MITKDQFIAWFERVLGARFTRFLLRQSFDLDLFRAGATHAERSRRRVREVDDPAPRIRAAIVDLHDDRLLVDRVRHANPRCQRQRAVSRGERVHVVAFAAGGLATVERTAVPGGTTLLFEVANARAVRDRLRIGERGSLGRFGGRRRRRVQRRFVSERRNGPGTVIAKEVVPWVLVGGAQVAGTRRGTASQDCNGKETPNLSSKSNIHRRVYQRLSSRLAPRKNARVVAAQGFSAQCSVPFDRCERRADARVRRTSPQTPG